MSTRTLFLALSCCLALAACNKDDSGNAKSESAPSSTSSATKSFESGEAGSSSLSLPKACEDYIARAEACFAKAAPEAAGMMREALEQSRQAWNSIPASAQEEGCKLANEQFAETAQALGCE